MARNVPGGRGRLSKMLKGRKRFEYRDEFPNAPYLRMPRWEPPLAPNRQPKIRRRRA